MLETLGDIVAQERCLCVCSLHEYYSIRNVYVHANVCEHKKIMTSIVCVQSETQYNN